MRYSNQRNITANRPVVTITSTVYDRRALDLNSDVPLINSLNHLTYLTSNSAKVRETVANDGALERLVSILHECHLNLRDCIQFGTKEAHLHLNTSLTNAERIRQQKQLALCAWKWTLSFQCLVLTGTRGTEDIRSKVVSSGIIPVLATVLDNYLIYYANYDHIKGEYLKFGFKSLANTERYFLLSQSNNESFEEYIEYLVGKDLLDLSTDGDFTIDSLLDPTCTKPTDFGEIWDKYLLTKKLLDGEMTFDDMDMIDLNKCSSKNENIMEDGDINNTADTDGCPIEVDSNVNDESDEENCFWEDIEQRPAITAPRSVFLGRIIPKQDDLIWSLQLLAFISKYTYLKPQLQNVEIVESLSFRAIVNRVQKRLSEIEKNMTSNKRNRTNDIIDADDHDSIGTHSINQETFISPNDIMTSSSSSSSISKTRKNESHYESETKKQDNCGNLKNDEIICELKQLVGKCDIIKKVEKTMIWGNNSFNGHNNNIIKSHFNCKDRNAKELNLTTNFKKNWSYDKMSKQLDEETWSFVKNKKLLNIFPLVEKFTVTPENSHDVIYWSSVVMRNSCRKNAPNGVRQCANFACGKWESFPREFAKCRRCKRTKYCSRKCQLNAWSYHRFWCHEVTCSSKTTSASTETSTRALSPNSTAAINNGLETTANQRSESIGDDNDNTNNTRDDDQSLSAMNGDST